LLGVGTLFIFVYLYLTFNFPINQVYESFEEIPVLLVGFSFGASFVAMFA